MKESAIIKTLMRTIPDCIKLLRSDQCANSKVNLTKLFENFGINMLKSANILLINFAIDV